MYRRDASLGPWTDIYAIGACIYACMQGFPPNEAPQRQDKDRLTLALTKLRGVYSDNLIEVVEWRSEEHTSELQSQSNLVCRLLLEKKKKTYKRSTPHSKNNEIILDPNKQ